MTTDAPGIEAAPAIVDDEQVWDVVIVGTGMGGGALGHALAAAGRSVLFLERGASELALPHPDEIEIEDPERRLALGYWPERIRMIVDGRAADRYAALGCAVGGSTRLYAAALERFDRRDLEPDAASPHPAGPWPIRYATLAPYYARAEELLGVKGTRDPLGDAAAPERPRPPAAAPVDGVLLRDFARAGLHPYRLHVGIAYLPGCAECIGKICRIGCKSDAASRFIQPAVAAGGATLRTGCEALRVESERGRATGVVYRREGRLRRARGRVIALAAGTLRSPALLLASAGGDHPGGLANSSGMVGRNLMFHASDWVAVWPSRKASADGPRKTISLRDFYRIDGARLGAFQSVGVPAGYGNILMFLYGWFDASPFRWVRPLRPLLRVPAKVAARLFGAATIFALILEDMPYPDNRVELDPEQPGRIVVHYRIREELAERAKLARRAIRQRLTGNRKFWVSGEVGIDDGHPCGTCRFGDDPATSVLDATCQAHDVAGLYVVDGSFMPSSAGANPSLTIAANALRVADAIDARLGAARA